MNKTSKILFLAMLLVSNSFLKSYAQDAKAKTVLDAVKNKYKALSAFTAHFTCNMSSPTTGVNETYKGEITVKSDKFYLKLPKQDIITDGTTQWTYLRDANEVNISSYEPDADDITPNKIYTIYESNYDYAYIELKSEQGKNFHIIELKPKDRKTQFFKIRLKITEKYGLKSWELFENNSNRYLYTINKFAEVEVGDVYFKYNKKNYPSNPKEIDMR